MFSRGKVLRGREGCLLGFTASGVISAACVARGSAVARWKALGHKCGGKYREEDPSVNVASRGL